MTNEVSLGELNRNIEKLTKTVESLRRDVITKDVWTLAELNRDKELREIEKDIGKIHERHDKAEERNTANKRMIFVALVAPFLLLLLQIYTASRQGGSL